MASRQMAGGTMMREVVVAQSVAPPWKEIVVNTGLLTLLLPKINLACHSECLVMKMPWTTQLMFMAVAWKFVELLA
jgi:hypothetical protein